MLLKQILAESNDDIYEGDVGQDELNMILQADVVCATHYYSLPKT